jgi:hypothetical protein
MALRPKWDYSPQPSYLVSLSLNFILCRNTSNKTFHIRELSYFVSSVYTSAQSLEKHIAWLCPAPTSFSVVPCPHRW